MTTNDMEFFHEASKLICGSLDAKDMLTETRAYLENFMPAEELVLSIYEPENRITRIIASASIHSETLSYVPTRLSEEGIRFIEAERFSRVMVINRPEMHPVAKHAVSKVMHRPICFMVLHLRVAGELLGVLAISARGRALYGDKHARLLEMLHDPFAIAMANTLKHQEILRLQKILADDYRYLAGELHQMSGDVIIGEEYGLKTVMDMVRQVAPMNSHVLLLGETGVGKEVIANAIHYSSPRHSGPFIKVDCGALTDTLVESELFGHEKGAFTGAATSHRGRFERAHGGTIFLDEIGNLPLFAQTRLLRAIQEKTIERVGGTDPVKVDTRIISATNRNLQQMVLEKSFREDLWFRLNVFPITVPPLRHRKPDILALVEHFVRRKCREMRIRARPAISSVQLKKLMDHDWPGNVRELENSVERALIRALAGPPGEGLLFDDVGRPPRQPPPLNLDREQDPPTLDEVMRDHIEKILLLCNNRIEGPDGAAGRLGVNPSTLRHRMRRLGIEFGKRRNTGGKIA